MDWSMEEESEEGSPLRRSRALPPQLPPAATASGEEEGSSSPPLRWVSREGSRSPSPSPHGSPGSRSPASRSPSRSPSPRRSTIMATSVRTTRRAAPRSATAAAGDQESGEKDAGMEDLLASLRNGAKRPRLIPPQDGGAGGSASVGGGGDDEEEEKGAVGPPVFDVEGGYELVPAFAFPQAPAPSGIDAAEVAEPGDDGSLPAFSFPQLPAQLVVDAAEVLDAFAVSEEVWKGKAAAELVDAAMGVNTGRRAEAIKDELCVNRRVLDIERLERWLRRAEATDELAWFADLCADEAKVAPSLDLFECAFRALERASARELHTGADARRRWAGSVPVPEFFICPISKKIMDNPVVISSGKTVDRSALEKWWKSNQYICPVTGEVLAHSMFIPNIVIALCILLWRAENGIAVVAAAINPPAISPQVEALFKEVTLMPHSPRCSEKAYDALHRLHKLIDEESTTVHLLGQNPGAIAKLASVLPETCLEPDLELDNIILGIMEKAASYDPNKAAFGDDQYTIPVLIARAWLGPVPTRAKCAQILGMLADDYYNKIKIGDLGGFAALIDLLSVGDIGVKKTVARAIASLCEAQENWSRFLKEDVADAAISLLQKDGLVLEAQAILMLAGGFDLAMVQIMDKLQALSDDESCEKMRKRLWLNFLAAKPGQRRAGVPSVPASIKARYSSSSSSDSSAEGSSAYDEQTKKDAKTIVSWLQKRCSYPRTYRYRD
ncbi:hypothetical protein QOZ80_4BG0357080 [Eleusine coracana subsp. coracana]|nr:hypothetical protein QOZ80_4BG0357080 [Eleusine coracana subsp. coracana]